MKVFNHFITNTLLVFLFFTSAAAQDIYSIEGKVLATPSDEPLIGASIFVEGTKFIAITDELGRYEIKNLKIGEYKLIFSYLGHRTVTMTVKIDTDSNGETIELDVWLEEGKDYDMESICCECSSSPSIAVSDNIFNKNTRNNSLDLASGLFVNNYNGEVNNTYQRRGLTEEHMTFVEDGMPVSMVSQYSPYLNDDMFVRTDASIKRIQANFGDEETLMNFNAAGGSFRFEPYHHCDNILVAGSEIGLQANGQELYNKTTFYNNHSNKKWNYTISGHYRYDGGQRPMPYAMSSGGQIKGSIRRVFSGFSVSLIGKYLNDEVGQYMPIFIKGGEKIDVQNGFSWMDNLTLPNRNYEVINSSTITENNQPDLLHSSDFQKVKIQDRTAILNVSKWAGKWDIDNSLKFSQKSVTNNHFDEQAFSPIFGANYATQTTIVDGMYALNFFGKQTIYDIENEEILAIAENENALVPPSFTTNDLPNGALLPFHAIHNHFEIQEWVNQFQAKYRHNNQTITLGLNAYAVNYDHQQYETPFLLTFEAQPRVLGIHLEDIHYIDSDPRTRDFDQSNIQVTSPNGTISPDLYQNQWQQIQTRSAAVYGHYQKTFSKGTVKGGIRYERLRHDIDLAGYYFSSGTSIGNPQIGISHNTEIGGLDGNVATLYDNHFPAYNGSTQSYVQNYNLLSYFLGASWNINGGNLFLKYSKNERLGDLRHFQYFPTSSFINDYNGRSVHQFIFGIHQDLGMAGSFDIITYFNREDFIHAGVEERGRQGNIEYFHFYNQRDELGLEFNISYPITRQWSIRGHLRIANRISVDKAVYIQPVFIRNSFNVLNSQLRINVDYQYTGGRNIERFDPSLTDFHTFHAGIEYDYKDFTLGLSVRNVFNEVGVLYSNSILGQDEHVYRNMPRAIYFSAVYDLKY